MTFEGKELSIQDGTPIELYEFVRVNARWRYTSAAADVEYGGSTWASATMSRSALESTSSEDRREIKITVTRDHQIAEMFRIAPPSDVIGVTVYRLHAGDADSRPMWVGRVLSVDWRGLQAELSCEPASASMNRTGLRRLYQRQCPHRLYGSACGVNRTLYEQQAAITNVSGNVVQANEFSAMPAGYLIGGVLEWEPEPGLLERRMIVGHSGDAVNLTHAVPEMLSGASVVVAPGCDHTTTLCGSRFSNTENFGGFPYIPTKNPFGGSPIY